LDPNAADYVRGPFAWTWDVAQAAAEKASCPEIAEDEHACRDGWHYRGIWSYRDTVAVRRCPVAERARIAARVGAERERLAGTIARCHAQGGFGFEGWEDRSPGAQAALEAAQAHFAAVIEDLKRGRSIRALSLLGDHGTGKTRLLLAIHFGLLESGVPVEWVGSDQLLTMRIKRLHGREEEREEAQKAFDRIARAKHIAIPDIGDSQRAERQRGEDAAVSDELRELLDVSGAAVAWASNHKTSEALGRDPSIGARVRSRILDGAVIVRINDSDRRIERMEVRR
jgi:hypothetical protein